VNLQDLRRKAGFKSARAFAEHLGIPVSTYTGYEQERIKLSLSVAWLIADELGCTLDELAGRDAPHKRSADPIPLTENERRIIQAYRSANPQGRAAIEAVAQSQEGMEGQSPRDLADTG